MHRFFPSLTALAMLLMASSFGACTVHHHHPGDAPMAGQPIAPSGGAPGQYGYDDPYYAADQRSPGMPIQGYAPAPRYQAADRYAPTRTVARRGDCNCDCGERAASPAFAPRSYAPAGPVTPNDVTPTNPADWLE